MKTRTTLILAVITISILAFIQFYDNKMPGTIERESRIRKLMVLEADQIRNIELTTSEGSFVFAKTPGSEWQIESPVKYPANGGLIGSLASELEFQERRATLDPKQMGDLDKALEQFGLKQPRIQIKVRTAQDTYQLMIGRETVRKGAVYGKIVHGKAQEYIILEQSLETLLQKTLDQWRSPKVFDFVSSGVTGMVLHQDTKEVDLEKDSSVWKLLKPLSTPADIDQVNSFLGNLLGIQAVKFLTDNPADYANYGLNSPYLVFDVKLGQDTQSLRIGKTEANGAVQYYGQLISRPAVFAVEKPTVDLISALLEKTRDCRIVKRIHPGQVQGIKFEKGKFSIEIARGEAPGVSWILPQEGGLDIDSAVVNDLLARVQNARAANFLPASDENRKKLDLLKPAGKLTIELKNDDNKDGVQSFTLVFSADKSGESAVESQFRDDLVTIPSAVWVGVPDQIPSWLAKMLIIAKEPEITALNWKRGADSFAVSREPGKDWPAEAQGGKIDPLFLKGQIRLLAGLKTQGWKLVSGNEFAQPAAVLSITAGKQQKTLELAGDARINQYTARFAGSKYSFLIDRSDYLALSLFPAQNAASPDLSVPPPPSTSPKK
ncbi:MAG: DUF4340 domain-containing protein [Methylacidiphilales bacterium]|nr:DUF4340 domain-containing protein [Candidatus Methylacidiphilales bacterium]